MHPDPQQQPNLHADQEAVRAEAKRQMIIGALWCIGGLAVTLWSYSSAAAGGTYVVTWGAVIYGGIKFVRGLMLYTN